LPFLLPVSESFTAQFATVHDSTHGAVNLFRRCHPLSTSALGERVMRDSRMSVNLRFFELALVLVRLDHVASFWRI
jgi:hypothetical protein